MTNPWLNLNHNPPYILDIDKPYINAFLSPPLTVSDLTRIDTDRLPEPRQGPISARLIILQSNPSLQSPHPSLQGAVEAMKALGDERSSHLPIGTENDWWRPRYKDLACAVSGYKNLANLICSLEYFPYASKNFGHGHLRLPSQNYTFEILRKALQRNETTDDEAKQTIVVVTRCFRLWVGAVPELASQLNKTVFVTKNPRSASISERNLGVEEFKKVLAALK
jgi:hypothetical protein